jgi:antitoxin (DNA-binding transcriptional repressor) of toxin-antitoxin stability system
METLTPSQARVGLGRLLKRVLAGEDIGIVTSGRIVALRVVDVESADPEGRCEVTPKQLEKFAKTLNEKVAKARERGTLREYRGDIEAAIKD